MKLISNDFEIDARYHDNDMCVNFTLEHHPIARCDLCIGNFEIFNVYIWHPTLIKDLVVFMTDILRSKTNDEIKTYFEENRSKCLTLTYSNCS